MTLFCKEIYDMLKRKQSFWGDGNSYSLVKSATGTC